MKDNIHAKRIHVPGSGNLKIVSDISHVVMQEVFFPESKVVVAHTIK